MKEALLSNLHFSNNWILYNEQVYTAILKIKNIRKVYSTYKERDNMGKDKWRGFTCAKRPAILGFLEDHL